MSHERAGRDHRSWHVARDIATLLPLTLLTNCGEFFVTREALVAARLTTSDGRVGVPCTVTALLFGDEHTRASAASGGDVAVKVGMLTPLNAFAPIHARVALRIQCERYGVITTPDREVEVALFRTPRLELGTITVPQAP